MNFKRFLVALVLSLCALLCAGCNNEPTPTPEPDAPATPTYNDPTHKTGEFKVTYKLGYTTVVHRYDAGELPDPPEVEDYERGIYNMYFVGWKSEFLPVSADTVYEASFDQVLKTYKATFIYGPNGERSVTKTQNYGQAPVPPEIFGDNDYKFVTWDHEIVASAMDVTYTAIYTNVIEPEHLLEAYTAGLFNYQNHNWRDMMQACPIFVLAYQEHEDPRGGAIRDRLLEQIDALCGEGRAPDFDAWCNWSYSIITATIAIVRDTPTVWDVLSSSQKSRLDTMMEAYAYLGSVATSDYNYYHTGPALRGNYYKTWNPNYRLANVPNIVFCCYYFGAGDMEAGADYVNERIRTFNEERYYTMLRRFDANGWDGAYRCWSTEGIVAGDGRPSSSTAKQMLVYGGTITHTTNDGKGLQSSSGVGINNGGRDYVYTGYLNTPFTLYEGEKILEDLIYYNYAGGKVTSEHYADGNSDGVIEKVAWIVDGSTSPYQGQMGMMTELASGVRSSTSYCSDDFTMVVAILTASSILPRYEVEGTKRTVKTDAFGNREMLYDYTKNAELWQMIQVGNEDFLYKFVTGYSSYAHGSYGVSSSISSEKGSAGSGYFMMKSIWRVVMKPKGDVKIFEDLKASAN